MKYVNQIILAYSERYFFQYNFFFLIDFLCNIFNHKLFSVFFFRYKDQIKPQSGEEINKLKDQYELNTTINGIGNYNNVITNTPRNKFVDTNAGNEKQSSLSNETSVEEPQVDNSSDDENVENENGSNESIRPHSHASTATTKSLRDVDGIVEEIRPKMPDLVALSGSSSIHEVISAKSDSTINEADTNGATEKAIDGNKLATETYEQKTPSKDNTTELIQSQTVDSTDGADERTDIMRIENFPEQLLQDAAHIPDEKELDENEPKSDSDSRSLSSAEESSDYPLPSGPSFEKVASLPINKIIKPFKKYRTPMLVRKNKVGAMKSSPPIVSAQKSKSKSMEMFPLTLRKFDKPREASINCLTQLDSPNWEVTVNGMQIFVRLIRHHPEIVEANLHAFCVALSKQVKNLRSQVSRSACQASAEFFETHAKHLEQECEELATQLLNRTADTNKFLRSDAAKALYAMCDNLPAPRVIQVVVARGAAHQNAIVRTAAADLCSRVVSRLGCDKTFSLNRECRDKLILAGANFLMEGSLDTRNNAKVLFKQLSMHPHYNRVLFDVIPQRIYRNIEKALRSIK